ncbi:cell adhesion molecule CEACAM6-like isoform 3-T3 [Sarcophilus harrisii]
MESPSEPQCRTLSPWRGILITASILSCWIQPTSAQVTIVPNPPFGEVNHNITLDIRGFTGPALTYTWYRKAVAEPNKIALYRVETEAQEPAGIREKVLPNGSLLIPNLTLNDTDDYHVTIVNSRGDIIFGQGNLAVYERTTKPNLTANRTSVIENDTLVFTCGTEQAEVDILWFFNKKSLILNERMKLSMKNQTLIIQVVKRVDAGSYECEIRNPISSNRSDPISLTVNYGPDYITFVPNSEKGEIDVKLKGSLTLECHVESYPPAQYIWQVNGTVNSAFSNNTYVIKNATQEDSGEYTCEAKNNVTNLSVSKSITVKVVENPSGGSNGSTLSGGAIAGIVIGVLAGVALIGGLIYFLFFRKTGGASEHHPTEHKSSAPNNSQTFSDSSPKMTEEVPYASVNFNAQKPAAKTQYPSSMDTVYSEIKK